MDAEPPIASILKLVLIGGGPVNATVTRLKRLPRTTMGYNLYITRKTFWHDESGPSVTRDEWITLVESDAELEFRRGDDSLTADWSGKCSYPDPWFAFDADTGAIDTKNPDKPIIKKMLEIAAKLSARVQGDDGEVYVTPTHYYHLDENGEPIREAPKGSWWQRLFGSPPSVSDGG